MTNTLRLAQYQAAPAGFYGMLGCDPAMLRLFADMKEAASLPVPIIVQGETGTGKELVIQAVHRLSRLRGRLVVVNVTTLSDSLAESELFGSVRGAFTGAEDRSGLVEEANGGTLFLDEAGDAALSLQAKLLRVIECGAVRRVGCIRDRPVAIRLVLSTQLAPESLVATHRWREDFYYRVSGVVLRVPRLRDRPSDIPMLIDHFLVCLGRPPLITGNLQEVLRYSWPGNVRELRRVVERSVFSAGNDPVTSRHLISHLSRVPAAPIEPTAAPNSLLAVKRNHIHAVMMRCQGDTTAAAGELGISRATLYRWLDRMDMHTRPATFSHSPATSHPDSHICES